MLRKQHSIYSKTDWFLSNSLRKKLGNRAEGVYFLWKIIGKMHILRHYKRLSLIMDAKDMFVLKALFILIIKNLFMLLRMNLSLNVDIKIINLSTLLSFQN